MSIPLNYFLDRSEYRTQKKTIESIAEAVADELSSISDAYLDNPGLARSAAHDVLGILRRSELGPRALVTMNLDQSEVLSHLLSHAESELRTASQERQGLIKRALTQFSSILIDSAPELPGASLAFMQAMLKSRNLPEN